MKPTTRLIGRGWTVEKATIHDKNSSGQIESQSRWVIFHPITKGLIPPSELASFTSEGKALLYCANEFNI